MGLFRWILDSQKRPHVKARAAHREERRLKEIARRATTTATSPSAFYAFYRSTDGMERKFPKEVFGPFSSREGAEAAVAEDIAEYDSSRRSYEVKRCTPAQFTKIWGSGPETLRR